MEMPPWILSFARGKATVVSGALRTLGLLGCCAALSIAIATPLVAQDELGLGKMWTFERPPLQYLEREYGLKKDEAWWTRMRLASLRFGKGSSASFVSPSGLILTNHHCVVVQMGEAQGASDWVSDGFIADQLSDEVKLK